MCLGRRDECLLTGPGKGGCDECSPEEGIRRRHGTEVSNSMAHSRASKWLAVAGGGGRGEGAGMKKLFGNSWRGIGLCGGGLYIQGQQALSRC